MGNGQSTVLWEKGFLELEGWGGGGELDILSRTFLPLKLITMITVLLVQMLVTKLTKKLIFYVGHCVKLSLAMGLCHKIRG